MQIVVALLEPLQEGGLLTAAAAKAMEELVVKGRALLQSKLQGLPPLPQSVAGLERVSEVLKQERGALTIEEQVRLLLQSLQHDSASVQATTVQASPSHHSTHLDAFWELGQPGHALYALHGIEHASEHTQCLIYVTYKLCVYCHFHFGKPAQRQRGCLVAGDQKI